ncbi:MAG: methyltransferase domain-containing protein [Acidobacteriota bacterium]
MRSTGVFVACLLFCGVASAQQAPAYSSKLAPYVASPSRVVELMLDMAKVKPGETLYDLGSGDGRILVAAAGRKANAVGIEINPKLVAAANDEINRAGVAEHAKVIQGDVMQTDFSSANVITLYMDTGSNAKLRPQLEKYLKPGSRVVSHDYEIPGWKPVRVEKTEERQSHTVYLYEIGPKK